ncbi:MAG TPA: TIM barrel protein [Steroidobacteraceae bacterium]|nr:TIM barrel protein [Steroidobacteraceae bacterium]
MRRRTLFTGAVALAVGAALTGPVQAQTGTAPAPFPRRKGRLKQGLWKINWGNDTQVPFEQMCTVAAVMGAYGFDVIPSRDWPILRRHGLDPLMVGPGKTDYLGGLIHPQIHAQTLAAISAQADLCAANDVHLIGLSAGQRRGMDYGTAADNAVAICRRLAPKLAATGVTLVIENVNDRRGADADLAREDMVFGHWDWGVEVVERVASPNVKLLCDIYHLQIMDGDVTYRLRRDIRHIGHIHVAGVPSRKQIDARQELNFHMIAETIADLGYGGYVCHEWRPTPGSDPVQDIAECMAILDV